MPASWRVAWMWCMPQAVSPFPYEAISWQIRDPWEAEDNLAAGMTRFSRDLIINCFRAAEWALTTLADWNCILPPLVNEERVPDAPKRRSFLRFVVRSTEARRGLADVILELFQRKGHNPLRLFRPSPQQGQARVDCYIEFETHDQGSKQRSLGREVGLVDWHRVETLLSRYFPGAAVEW